MASEIARQGQGGAIATPAQMTREERKKLDQLKDQCAKGTTDEEFEFFTQQCKRLGLDPMLKHAYMIPRNGSRMFELSIDGYRVVAGQTGEFAGRDEPVWTGTGTIQANGNKHPMKCSVTVYRIVQGQRCAFVGTAVWADFYAPRNAKWNDMPFRMLAVRAETEALKLAFAKQLGGIYTKEEMDDFVPADNQPEQPTPNAPQSQQETRTATPSKPATVYASDPLPPVETTFKPEQEEEKRPDVGGCENPVAFARKNFLRWAAAYGIVISDMTPDARLDWISTLSCVDVRKNWGSKIKDWDRHKWDTLTSYLADFGNVAEAAGWNLDDSAAILLFADTLVEKPHGSIQNICGPTWDAMTAKLQEPGGVSLEVA
jgi:phage recombination protein Bet